MRRLIPPVLAMLVAIATWFAATSDAASSSVTVTLSVASSTVLSSTGCAPDSPGITALGVVQPGTPAVTTSDCVVGFGSSNDSSTLRVAQSDGGGASAMAFGDAAPVASGTGTMINELQAWDQLNVWIAANNGIIRHSVDGGLTWTAQASTTTEHITGMEVLSPTNAWLVTQNGQIRVTSDGGTTWTTQTSGTTLNLDDIEAIDANTLVAVGGTTGVGVVLRTTNAGGTWTTVTPGGMGDATAVSMANATRGWLVGRSGLAMRTDDGGLTWTSQASISTCTGNDLRGVQAITTSVVVAVGHIGRICRSVDGGSTWSLVASGTIENLWDIERAPDGTLWSVARGTASPVLRSFDDGASWQAFTTEALLLTSVLAFDRDTAWWAGGGGFLAHTPATAVPDYGSSGAALWGGSGSMFGICLRAAPNATPVWTPNATCAIADASHWKAVPANTSLAASRVATTATSVVTAEGRFRFGARPSASATPGRYVAGITFEVLAPST